MIYVYKILEGSGMLFPSYRSFGGKWKEIRLQVQVFQFLLILFSFCFNTATKHLQVFERLRLTVSEIHSMGRKWIANQWGYKYLLISFNSFFNLFLYSYDICV